jgi:hypothetical protein
VAWDCEQTIQGNNRILLPCPFTARVLAIDITSANQKATWYRSGWLRAILDVDGQPFIGLDIETTFGQQVVQLPFANYQIDFAPRKWLDSTTIRIKQLTSTQVLNTFMSASYDPGNKPVGNDSAATVAASVTNVVLAAANPLRAPEGFIVNNSTKNLWVTFTGTAATAAAPATKVLPNGGNIDIPGNYTGAINGIWEAGATLSAVVHEFSYI